MKIGKVTGNVLKRSVLRPITYRREEILKGAGLGEDCALFAVPEGFMLTSCVQEAAVAGKADMEVLVGRCANSLAAAGSRPLAAMLGVLLPKEAAEPMLKQLMTTAHDVCQKFKMQIAGGHTTVSSAVTCPFVTATAYGLLPRECTEILTGPKAGQDIVLSKWIGLEGTALLVQKYKDRLLDRYPVRMITEAACFDTSVSVIPEAEVAVRSGAAYMHDVSEGGILAALWEMAEGAAVGLDIDLRRLPIRQETVEVCEYLGANPYELSSGGCLIMTTDDGESLVQALSLAGIPARIIGKVTAGKERLIRNEEEIRYMDRPAVDEIYKFIWRKEQ